MTGEYKMNDNQKVQDGITYFSTVLTNFFYIIMVGILYSFDGLSIEGIGGISFAIGVAISIISMSYIALRALKLNSDRAKTIIKLAIFHIPALVGLTILFVNGYLVM